MKHLYQFHITGMTCHACESLITMDLEDAGFTLRSISHASGQLMIDLDEEGVTKAKEVIEQSGTYTVDSVYITPNSL